MSRRSVIALLVASAMVAALTACGGDSDDAEQGTVEPGVTAALPTKGPTPVVVGTVVTSSTKHYRVEFPEGWQPRFDFIRTPTSSSDVFFKPGDPEDVRTTISVSCHTPGEDMQSYLEAYQTSVEATAEGQVAESEMTVSGMPAIRLQYEQQIQVGMTLQRVDVIVAGKPCGYVLGLSALPEDAGAAGALFAAFLDSFEVLP